MLYHAPRITQRCLCSGHPDLTSEQGPHFVLLITSELWNQTGWQHHLGMAVISGILTITLTLTWVTIKLFPVWDTSTDILVRTPFPPAMHVTLHRQHNPKRKQDLHLSREKKNITFITAFCPMWHPRLWGGSTLRFRDKQKRYSPIFSRAWFCCRHMWTGHINSNIPQQNS